MLKYLTYIFLSTWPIFQLIKLFSLDKNQFVVDALKLFSMLILCVALVTMFVRKKKFTTIGPFLIWFVFFAYLLLNVFCTGDVLTMVRVCADQYNISIMPLILYFVIGNFGAHFNRKILVFSVIASGVIIGGIGIAESIAGHNLIGEVNYEGAHVQSVYRANGPFLEGIGYSTTVLLYIPFIYYFLKEKLISKAMFFVLFCIFSAGVLVTLSRASMISYLIVVIILFSGNNLKSIFISTYLSLTLAIGIYIMWHNISSSTIFTKRITPIGNVVGRWNQYKECLEIFAANPLMGIGYNVYKKTHYYFIHNSYLKDLVELGIFGFVFHMTFIFSIVLSHFKKVFLNSGPHSVKVRLSFVIIILIVANTINLLGSQYFTLPLFIMVALLNLNPEGKGSKKQQSPADSTRAQFSLK